MGLLDFMNTPEGQGLLSAAFGGMASARRGAPINSIGRAGLAGLQGYSGAIDQQNQRTEQEAQTKYRNMQIAQIEQAAKTAEAQRAAQQKALSSMSPEIQQAVSAGVPFEEIWKRKNPEDMYKVVGGSMVKVSGDNVQPVYQAPDKEAALPWYVRRTPDGRTQIDPAYADLERTKASFGRPPAQPMQPVAYVDPASGQTVWGTITEAKGKPAANFAPSVQGQIVTAKETAKAGVEQQTDANKAVKKSNQLLSAAQEADTLLRGNVTQSGTGAAVDAAGRLVGVSPESSQNAAKLEALSGWMVANVPRMEGPQSNFDVKNYQEMAGKIGDRTIPVAERQAALKTVIALQEKYKHLNTSNSTESDKPKQVRRYNPQTGRIE